MSTDTKALAHIRSTTVGRKARYFKVSSTNLSFENHCVSNSPSKLEGVGGEYVTSFDSYHTPQSLRDSSSILEEQPDIQLFIFVELTLF